MTGRKMTRLEGVLLGALVEVIRVAGAPSRDDDGIALCHRGLCTADECGRCGPLLRAQDLVARVLKRQRKKDPKRTTGGRRRPLAPVPGGLAVAERCARCGAVVNSCHECGEPVAIESGPEPAKDDGRGGKRVGERRQGPRTYHIIDADSSARDVELARHDLVEFFGDVLNKHHGGGF